MDAVRNPYSPGAGRPPPFFAGREEEIEHIRVAMFRMSEGKSERGIVLSGLRGVGNTVLLRHLGKMAEEKGIKPIHVEAPENTPLLQLIIPELRFVLLGMSDGDKKKKALSALASIIQTYKPTLKLDIGVMRVEFQPHLGLADSGNLESDLRMLMQAVGEAAQAAKTAVVFFMDELQYVEKAELEALCSAFHLMAQKALPVLFVGAGLPQTLGLLGQAKSYAERLFEVREIGALSPSVAGSSILEPARRENVEFTPSAIDAIFAKTKGYPYFLQEWGKHAWDMAKQSPITVEDVECASDVVIKKLDAGFFRIRFNRLTPSEKRYLRAMAELRQDIARSGDIAAVLNRKTESLAPTRAKLIEKGMAYSPSHGDIAFTVPLFGDFMKRVMPSLEYDDAGIKDKTTQ